jgi:subtilase family serine protease
MDYIITIINFYNRHLKKSDNSDEKKSKNEIFKKLEKIVDKMNGDIYKLKLIQLIESKNIKKIYEFLKKNKHKITFTNYDIKLLENKNENENFKFLVDKNICNTFLKTKKQGVITPHVFTGFSPQDIIKAYSIDKLHTNNNFGEGCKIAVVIAYTYKSLQSDLDFWCDNFNIPRKKINIIPMGQGIPNNNEWGSEACLDIQMIVAIAQKSEIYLVQAKSNSMKDMMNAVKHSTENLNCDIVSMSWGSQEYQNVTNYDNTVFKNKKVIYVASSGDDNYVSFPSSSKNNISIGGTSLTILPDGSRNNEITWSKAGSGFSKYITKPSYQKDIVSGIKRSIPDFSAVANPYTGVLVYCSALGGMQIFGGTSVSAPISAGFFAIVCGYRNKNNLLKLTSVSTFNNCVQNKLYEIYKNQTNYKNCFYDINQGIDGTPAKTGYDCMGIGSPNYNEIFKILIN